MSNIRVRDRDYPSIERRVNGWKIVLGMHEWGFAHVFATKTKKREFWNVSQMFKLVRGRWVLGTMKDKWAIRSRPRYADDATRSNWDKVYSPPGSRKVVDGVRRMCSKLLNKQKSARWRLEGVRRTEERKQALENYFQTRRDMERIEKRSRRAKAVYTVALKLEKAYTPKRPR